MNRFSLPTNVLHLKRDYYNGFRTHLMGIVLQKGIIIRIIKRVCSGLVDNY